MEELISKIKTETQGLLENIEKFHKAGNKAAGARARKNTLELAKLGKEFRKLSVKQ